MSAQAASQPLPRAVLRKAPPIAAAAAAEGPSSSQAEESAAQDALGPQATLEPYCLLDAATWQMAPQAFAEVLGTGQDFGVVGVLGAQGLGKSALLNRLLGFEGELAAAGPHPTPAFPVWPGAAAGSQQGQQQYGWRHCTQGVSLRVSADRLIALDTQPLFSASVLSDMAAQWQQPPAALAAPAVAAASDAKAAAVPLEGVQLLAQLQLAVLLLSTCHRVLVFCEGLDDWRTWGLLATAEMLARGIPDPSLPPRDPPQQPSTLSTAAAGGPAGGATAGAQQGARQPPQQEHLAEVVLVHVLPADGSTSSGTAAGGFGGGAWPHEAQLQLLERRLEAFFATSRLPRPGPLRMLEHLAGDRNGNANGGSGKGMSYWVLPALEPAGAEEPAAWSALVAALLARPPPPFARRCSEQQWLRAVAGDCWRAVRKSADIATFYSRLARTQLKGAGGWALAR